eukprot:TRINITY_DN6207_c0_g1_i2.p1 TRINITY_DN6207_c0_g1~~TRINITY_DN6207_c0_g1_i2.p1  ORF type:complete len:346 (+),score=95.33 TRINITY_DN6207_c0_g1_i2:122-1039(+)
MMKSAVGSEVIVKNSFAGVNYIDTYFRTGLYPATPPFTVGQEGAGEVVAVGPDGDKGMIGKKVGFWGSRSGSYAEYVRVGPEQLAVLPESLELKVAAASLLQGLTSHYLCHSSYQVKKGDWVLVHAAAGGCGLLLGQMCKNAGATVIGTCGTAEKAELAKKVGKFDHIINYTEVPNFAEEVRKLVPAGVNAVFDGVGKSTFEGSIASLRTRGTMVSFGNASGAVEPVAPLTLTKNGSLFLTRPTLKDYISCPEERAQRTADLFKWLSEGSVVQTINNVLPLQESRKAHEILEGRQTTGKVVLQIA